MGDLFWFTLRSCKSPPHTAGMQTPRPFGIVINNPEIISKFPTQGIPATARAQQRSSVFSHTQ